MRAVGPLRARWWRSDTAGAAAAAATWTGRRTVPALPNQSQHTDFNLNHFSPWDADSARHCGVCNLLFFSVGRWFLFFLLFMSHVRFVFVLFLFFFLLIFLHFFFLFLKIIKHRFHHVQNSSVFPAEEHFRALLHIWIDCGRGLQC